MHNQQERADKEGIVISKKFSFAVLATLISIAFILLAANWNRIICNKEIRMEVVYGDEVDSVIRRYQVAGWELEYKGPNSSASHMNIVPLRFCRCQQ
jgi:hypothetical protein